MIRHNVYKRQLKSKVAFYNFGEAGKAKTDNEVGMEEYDGKIIPEVYFMDDTTSIAVSDSSFIIYEGTDVPKKKKEIELNQEIKSVFHTDKYIGFTLLNKKKSGYEERPVSYTHLDVYKRQGSLSAADIFTYLYFEEMNIDPKDPKKADRDRFVLSKGHTACLLYTSSEGS